MGLIKKEVYFDVYFKSGVIKTQDELKTENDFILIEYNLGKVKKVDIDKIEKIVPRRSRS